MTISFSGFWCWVTAASALLCSGCRQDTPPGGASPKPSVTFKPQEMADAIHAVVAADREVYALHVVQRLQGDEHVIKASEQWKEEKALPLPVQMLRMGAETVQQKGAEFHYVLRSLWPINPKNAAETGTERSALEFVAAHPETNYYGEESLGGRLYFVAVYPDVALTAGCVECHNRHPASPKKDFKPGEVMGGLVVRVPLEF